MFPVRKSRDLPLQCRLIIDWAQALEFHAKAAGNLYCKSLDYGLEDFFDVKQSCLDGADLAMKPPCRSVIKE